MCDRFLLLASGSGWVSAWADSLGCGGTGIELSPAVHAGGGPCISGNRNFEGSPRKGVGASATMWVWECEESGAKVNQTGCYSRPPILGNPLVPSRAIMRAAVCDSARDLAQRLISYYSVLFIMFVSLSLSLYIYIYIMYMCMILYYVSYCVCVYIYIYMCIYIYIYIYIYIIIQL